MHRERNLSDVEMQELDLFIQERDLWKEWAQAEIKANPSISENQLKAKLNSADFPLPNGDSMSRPKRAKLIDRYIANAGGFDNLKAMLLAYDIRIIKRVCPELGFNLPTPSEAIFRQLVGDRGWGFEFPVDDREQIEVSRDVQEGGNRIEIVQECRGTINGTLRKVRRTILHTTNATTVSEWVEV